MQTPYCAHVHMLSWNSVSVLCALVTLSHVSCGFHSPGKNTGVGFHFLLQCVKVKSESEVAQSCLTLSDPADCSPPYPRWCLSPGCMTASLLPTTAVREVVWLHVGSTCSSSEQRVPETCRSPQDWVVSAFYGFWVVTVCLYSRL